jgi:hypothetical protein
MPEQIAHDMKKDDLQERQPIPQAQMQSKLNESRQELSSREETSESLLDQTQDCMNEQFDNYLQMPAFEIFTRAEKRIEEMEEREKSILSEDEKEDVKEKTLEDNLLAEGELAEVVDEEVMVCGDMKVIVQRIKVAMANGTFREIAQRMARVEEAGAEALQEGFMLAANSRNESVSEVEDEIGNIKESVKSDLGKEMDSIAEGAEGMGKEEIREQVRDAMERSLKETGLRRIGERIGLIVENKDMKMMKELLEKCEEDEKILERAMDELPKLKDNQEEFRQKCKELFRDRPEFMKEIDGMAADDVLKRVRSYLDELETNKYVEKMRRALQASGKKALKEARNMLEEAGEAQEGCGRLKEIVESGLEKEDMIDALKELARDLRQGRLRWRLEDLLQEQRENEHPKEKLLKSLRIILRQEYLKLLACRTFRMAASEGHSRIIDELVDTIERNIDAHMRIAAIARIRKTPKGMDGGNGRSERSSMAFMLKGLLKANGHDGHSGK